MSVLETWVLNETPYVWKIYELLGLKYLKRKCCNILERIFP
jgi:hypothetical protein